MLSTGIGYFFQKIYCLVAIHMKLGLDMIFWGLSETCAKDRGNLVGVQLSWLCVTLGPIRYSTRRWTQLGRYCVYALADSTVVR